MKTAEPRKEFYVLYLVDAMIELVVKKEAVGSNKLNFLSLSKRVSAPDDNNSMVLFDTLIA